MLQVVAFDRKVPPCRRLKNRMPTDLLQRRTICSKGRPFIYTPFIYTPFIYIVTFTTTSLFKPFVRNYLLSTTYKRTITVFWLGDRSPSGYLYAVVPRSVSFAQRRIAHLNLTRHAVATAICSRCSRRGGVFGGGGCGTAAKGHGLGSGSLRAGSGARSVFGVH